ncbi:MAG: N-6 DNA methylase [Erysipelotrichaceae bacterium]|nr:N-6 DNA methylase [Erysipelotrichaceae bacterium]
MNYNYLEEINNERLLKCMKMELMTFSGGYSYNKAVIIAYAMYKMQENPNMNKTEELLQSLSDKKKIQEILNDTLSRDWDIVEKFKNEFTKDELLAFILFEPEKKYLSRTNKISSGISKLALKLLDIKEDETCLELCSGTGSFMLNAFRYTPMSNYMGIESMMDDYAIALLRADVIGKEVFLKLDDALDYESDEKADKLFSNYPFGFKRFSLRDQALKLEQKLNINDRSLEHASSDWVFNAKLVEQLKQGGKAIAIMSNGSAWNTGDRRIRRFFVNNKYIEAVIALPEYLLCGIRSGVTLVVFSYDNQSIRFVDASKEYKIADRRYELTDENIDTILHYLSVDTEYSTTKTIEEVVEHDYSFSVINYTAEKVEFKNKTKFRNVANINRGVQLRANEIDKYKTEEATSYKFITLANVNDGYLSTEENCQYLTKIPEKWESYCVKNNSLLISKLGSSTFKSAVVNLKDNETLVVAGNFFIIELEEDKIDPFYLQAFLMSDLGVNALNHIKSGTHIYTMSIDRLSNMDIPLPSLEVQKKIGKVYKDTVEELIVLNKQLEKNKNKLNAIFEEEGGNQ